MSKWENILIGLNYGHGRVEHDSEDSEDYQIKRKEVALKHSDTEAIVKLTDDGMIDIFAGPQLGVRIDSATNSINFIGDSVNVISNNFNIKSNPNGFTWNGHSFNPEMYAGEENGTMKKANHKVRYSEGIIEMMKDLGLPVESVDKEEF